MRVKDLKPNVKNPRRMSETDKKNLLKSLQKLGDLSGIIYNRRTKRLVGGHQRNSVLPPDTDIKITEKYENPTHAGTVAEGHIFLQGEKFKYREVDWDEKTETEALLAANKHSGQWDEELLRINFSDFPDMDLDVTGFDISELEDLGIDIEVDYPTQDLPFNNGFNDDESETDEQYLRKNKGPDYEADRERLPDMVKRTYNNTDETPADAREIDPNAENPFDKAGQNTKVTERRIVLIIDLDSDEDKKNLKEEIREVVEKFNGRFF